MKVTRAFTADLAGIEEAMTEALARHDPVTLFLAGDVMTGRGIDQGLPYPGDPRIYERFCSSALDYVRLAESSHGAIRAPFDFSYPWGDALAVLESRAPDARIINLETAVTLRGEAEAKGINYRMSPANIDVLKAAHVDVCSLANNHVLDWGRAGLTDTLATLKGTDIGAAGAGLNSREAAAPYHLQLTSGRAVVIVGCACEDSGIPRSWAASPRTSGINLLPSLSQEEVWKIGACIAPLKQEGTIAIVSIHWGGNWGYEIRSDQRRFAQALIDHAGVDIVHGHSSHHPQPVEIYRGKLILYGCGDFINDYEGIKGHEIYRPDLHIAYFAKLDANSGQLLELELVPFVARRLRLERCAMADAHWLARCYRSHALPGSPALRVRDDATLSVQL